MNLDRRYLRACLIVPPLVHALLSLIPNRADGFMAASLYFGAVPYLVWSVIMFFEVGRRPANRLRRMVLLAPLTYLAVFLINFVVVGMVTTPLQDWGGVVPEVLGGGAFLTPFVLLLGYMWVGLALLGWRLRSVSHPANGAGGC